MDDIKPNQSLDGMSGGKPPQPTGAPQSNTGGLNQFNDADYAPDSQQEHQNFDDQQHGEPQQSSGGGKGLKIALTIFVILFIAASAAAAYFYMESSKEVAPTTADVDVTKLQQQNASLTYDNKTLTKQTTAYKIQINNLTTTAEQLKTKCGANCKVIVIPQ